MSITMLVVVHVAAVLAVLDAFIQIDTILGRLS